MSRRSAPYNSKAIANIILNWASDDNTPVTPLKLQKLLFFIHVDYMAKNNTPLLDETFEAWSYGPVLPSIYEEFKHFSGRPIDGRASRFDPISRVKTEAALDLEPAEAEEIRKFYKLYIPVSAGALSQRSHRPGGPWAKALASFDAYSNANRRISNDLILKCSQTEH